MSDASPAAERAVIALLVAACLGYAAVAVGGGVSWISALVAAVVAVLLWRRHRRARFAAYIFLSAVAVRGVVTGRPVAWLFGAAAILLLQTKPARRAWPRLSPRWRRSSSREAES